MKTKQKFTTYELAIAALMAAVMCVLGPVSLQIGPIPLSLTNLVVLFSVMLLGTKLGTCSLVVYLLLGAVGLPVFSGYSGSLAKLAGPTGGYLIGFIPMAILAGIVLEKCGRRPLPTIAAMVAGVAVDYIFGTAWFVFQMQCELWYALTVCVFPFLIGDGIKLVLAYVLGGLLRQRLGKAGLLKAA